MDLSYGNEENFNEIHEVIYDNNSNIEKVETSSAQLSSHNQRSIICGNEEHSNLEIIPTNSQAKNYLHDLNIQVFFPIYNSYDQQALTLVLGP